MGSLFVFHPSGMCDRDDRHERKGDKVPFSKTLSAWLLVVRNGTQTISLIGRIALAKDDCRNII